MSEPTESDLGDLLTLHNLMDLLGDRSASWYKIGFYLHLKKEELDKIDYQNKDPDICMIKMFGLWLSGGACTWSKFKKMLNDVGLGAKAQNLYEKLKDIKEEEEKRREEGKESYEDTSEILSMIERECKRENNRSQIDLEKLKQDEKYKSLMKIIRDTLLTPCSSSDIPPSASNDDQSPSVSTGVSPSDISDDDNPPSAGDDGQSRSFSTGASPGDDDNPPRASSDGQSPSEASPSDISDEDLINNIDKYIREKKDLKPAELKNVIDAVTEVHNMRNELTKRVREWGKELFTDLKYAREVQGKLLKRKQKLDVEERKLKCQKTRVDKDIKQVQDSSYESKEEKLTKLGKELENIQKSLCYVRRKLTTCIMELNYANSNYVFISEELNDCLKKLTEHKGELERMAKSGSNLRGLVEIMVAGAAGGAGGVIGAAGGAWGAIGAIGAGTAGAGLFGGLIGVFMGICLGMARHYILQRVNNRDESVVKYDEVLTTTANEINETGKFIEKVKNGFINHRRPYS